MSVNSSVVWSSAEEQVSHKVSHLLQHLQNDLPLFLSQLHFALQLTLDLIMLIPHNMKRGKQRSQPVLQRLHLPLSLRPQLRLLPRISIQSKAATLQSPTLSIRVRDNQCNKVSILLVTASTLIA